MVKVIFKKGDRPNPADQQKPDEKQQLINEVALVAKKLQDNIDENIRVLAINTRIKVDNESLSLKKISLQFLIETLNKDIDKKYKELNEIGTIIGSRNDSLNSVNNIIAKLIPKYSAELSVIQNKLVKAKLDESNYNKLMGQHDTLRIQINKLEAIRSNQIQAVEVGKTEHKKIESEKAKNRAQIESFKAQQTDIIKNIRFYANRLNRYYQGMQMKPVIDLSNL